jgi:hypothetical protein
MRDSTGSDNFSGWRFALAGKVLSPSHRFKLLWSLLRLRPSLSATVRNCPSNLAAGLHLQALRTAIMHTHSLLGPRLVIVSIILLSGGQAAAISPPANRLFHEPSNIDQLTNSTVIDSGVQEFTCQGTFPNNRLPSSANVDQMTQIDRPRELTTNRCTPIPFLKSERSPQNVDELTR